MFEKWFEIEKYVNDNENEVTIKEIARIFNYDYHVIYNHYKKLRMLHKFKHDTKYEWNSIDREVIPKIELISLIDVSKRYNIPYPTVVSHYNKLNIAYKFKPDTKYDWNSIEKEIKENINKLTITDVSEMYNIPYSTIYAHFKKIGLLHIFYK